MDICTAISNALAAAMGAIAGAYAAYKLGCEATDKQDRRKFLGLLLILHEQIALLDKVFVNVAPEMYVEKDGERGAIFNEPLPAPRLTPEQMQLLFEICPSPEIPQCLIAINDFCRTHNYRIQTHGFTAIPVATLEKLAESTEYEIASIKTMYKQESGRDFPRSELNPASE